MRYEKEVTQLIATETSLTLGTTLQYGRFTEESPERCTSIIYNQTNFAYFDVPDRMDVNIEVISRAESYEAARDDSEEVYNKFHRRIDKDLPLIDSGNAITIQTSEATTGSPRWIGLDENKLNMWSATYLLRLKITE